MKFLKILTLLFLLITVTWAYAQDRLPKRTCTVEIEALAGEYWGECKKGLADGEGIAQGKDRYEGEFKKGLPHGEGVYQWADGNYYIGQFKKGMRHGEGRLYLAGMIPDPEDPIPMSLWKNDEFVSEIVEPEYKIGLKRNVVDVTPKFIRTTDKPLVRIYASEGSFPPDADIQVMSGQVQNFGNYIMITEPNFPFSINLKFNHVNKLNTSSQEVIVEFELITEGEWEIRVGLQ